MELIDFIRYTHSGVRWLVVLISVIALVWLVYGLATRREYDRNTHRIMTAFSSLIGLQWLIGLVFMVFIAFQQEGQFIFTGYQWSHAGIMTIVLVLAHVHMMLKRRPDNVRYIGGLLSVMGALGLVYIGVVLVPQGWMI